MNRGAWISTHLLRWQHYLWISCLALVLTVLTSQSALAQSGNATSAGHGRPVVTQDYQTAALSEWSAVQNSEHDDSPIISEALHVNTRQRALRPPLPFRAPQIGPLIRQVPMDDIARRTTAFFPQALDNLTAVELPDEEKWIRVDLSEQIVVAYQHERPVRAFVVSTGLPGTPTVTGQYRIRMKVEEQTMSGGEGSMYYNLPGVKWVQYFYGDYSFHGTYWHSNFGHPMSHGCVNMTNTDAKWLFDWAGPTWDGESPWYPSSADNPGTLVIITP